MSKKSNLAEKPVDHLEESQEPQQEQESSETNLDRLEVLRAKQMRKIQNLSKDGVEVSPLKINLVQSESLRIAQEKIVELEREIEDLRRINESLTSSGDVLIEKVDKLMVELEESHSHREDEKAGFESEKEVLLTTLEDTRKEVDRLKEYKKDLESRLSKDLQNIRVRENSLENKLELLKLEGSVLKRDKDKQIIELKNKLNKLNESLKTAYRKSNDLQNYITQLKNSSRKTVSVLRATIHNLEGYRVKQQSETQSSIVSEDDQS